MSGYMRFNINNYVLVQLNERGIAILKEQHEQLCRLAPKYNRPFVPPDVNPDGYSKFQMHNFMNIFGGHMRLGLQMPFDSDIKFMTKDLKGDGNEPVRPDFVPAPPLTPVK